MRGSRQIGRKLAVEMMLTGRHVSAEEGARLLHEEVSPQDERAQALALRWMVSFSQARKGVPMRDALATEIRDASEGQGSCIRKRDEMHKMAQANKAFAHFRW